MSLEALEGLPYVTAKTGAYRAARDLARAAVYIPHVGRNVRRRVGEGMDYVRSYFGSGPTIGPRAYRVRSRYIKREGKRGYLRRSLLPELKYQDQSKVQGAIASVANMSSLELDPAENCIGCPIQGSTATTRDGNMIIVRSITITGNVYWPILQDQLDAPVKPECKIWLVQDKSTCGAQLNSEDVFTNTGATTLTCCHPLRVSTMMNRFRILKTLSMHRPVWQNQLDGANTASYGATVVGFHIYKRCAIPIRFSGNAGSVADIVDNSIHIIAAITTTAGLLSYNTRIRFTG